MPVHHPDTGLLPAPLIKQLREANLDPGYVVDVIERTLDEDLQWGPDVTTLATIGSSLMGTADIVARAHGVLAGVPVAAAVAYCWAGRYEGRVMQVDVQQHCADGSRVTPGTKVLSVTAPVVDLLTFERTMLNLISQLSGVSTHTAAWVEACAGTTTKVRDTRKTIPGIRILQKYAVRCGGGVNHRMGLGDAALVKDNHIVSTGSLSAAVEKVRAYAPDLPIEVECDTLAQVAEAIEAGVRLILLDNMSPDQVRQALEIIHPAGALAEASGGLTLEVAAQYAATGVDFLAVGGLTHSSLVLDLGLDLRA